MKPSIKDKMAVLRDEMEAAVRIEVREIHGKLMEVKVYPDSRGGGDFGEVGGAWGSLRKKGGMNAARGRGRSTR